MKIIVTSLNSGEILFRPDNTLIRDSSDLYLPSFAEGCQLSAGIVFKIEKPAKSVSGKFAHRYITHYSPALIVEPLLKSGSPASLAQIARNMLDNTTRVPKEFIPIVDAESSNATLGLWVDGREVALYNKELLLRDISNNLLERLSSLFSLKIGDFIYIELLREDSIIIRGEVDLKWGQTSSLGLEIK